MNLDILSLLQYFGITADKITPFVIFGVIFWLLFLRPSKGKLGKISSAITEIQTILRTLGYDTRHLVEAPGSPLQPTEYGAKLIKESGLERILNDKKQALIEELNKLLPDEHTPYDVQEGARKLMISKKDDSDFKGVKDYAYKNGLDADVILQAGGLWLRDDFLGEERKVKKIN